MIDGLLIIKILPQLLSACIVTFKIAFGSTLIGMVGGILIAFAQRSSITPLRWITNGYVEIVRGTPMVVQIAFLFYGLKLPFVPIVVAICAIGLNSAAYVSQVIKSGIKAVSRGQIEAAKTLGLTPLQTMRFIILPQALRIVLPALVSEFTTLIKDSSLAYLIGVNELFKVSRGIITTTYDVMTVYCIVALLYFGMTYSISLGMKIIENRWNASC